MKIKRKIIIAIFGLSIVTGLSVVTLNSQRKEKDEAKIVIQQLEIKNGIIPVEIKNPQAVFKSLSAVENISFVVKNNTNKNIRALCLAYSIQLEKDKIESKDTFFHTVETFVHKDISETQNLKPIVPGQETIIEDNGETVYEGGSIIKGIEAKIDYVEFEDGTTLGPNEKGETLISQIRDGASKYKNWLVRQDIENNKSMSVIISLIQKDDIPTELGLTSPRQNTGAKIYRRYLRQVYETRSIAGLEEVLSK